jgi:hypothetical protein
VRAQKLAHQNCIDELREQIGRGFLDARALPSRTQDLSLSRQNNAARGGSLAAPVIPAPESVIESLPSVALSPAQVTDILNPTGGEFTLFLLTRAF